MLSGLHVVRWQEFNDLDNRRRSRRDAIDHVLELATALSELGPDLLATLRPLRDIRSEHP